MMMNDLSNQLVEIETTCGSLLRELQKIWNEVGEPDDRRNKLLLEVEMECLEVYRRKVEEAKTCRAHLQQEIASIEAEIADIFYTLGEQPENCDLKACMNLNERLGAIIPILDNLRQRKIERKSQFVEVFNQLQEISKEISAENKIQKPLNETDLSLKRLEELRGQLTNLQREKCNRLKLVEDLLCNLKSLCVVLGEDFERTVHKIHPSLDNKQATKDVSGKTIENLAMAVQHKQEVKIQRFQKLQDLATSLLELWHLMDTPIEEQRLFENVTSTIAVPEPEITEPNMLSLDNIDFLKGEVSRLQQLKSSKMKEIILKKRLELEEICRKTHMITEEFKEYPTEAIESGSVDPKYLLDQMELQIANAREEAISRKEISEKVEKWFVARDEEYWLEEYNRDENRYNAGRGAHLILKRAEKARVMVNKIPAMVDTLILKVKAWEKERETEFFYDGVQLLSILNEYNSLRKGKEQERQRQKDLKKLQGQLKAEEEALYGSKGSPGKSAKKTSRTLPGTTINRKLSLGGAMLQNLKPQKVAPREVFNKKTNCLIRDSPLSCQQTGSFSGRRNSEIAGHSVKKCSSIAAKGRKDNSSLARKPLSPISLAMASRANIANFMEEQNKIQNGTFQTAPNNKTPLATPCKPTVQNSELNRTPKAMPIPVPSTPSTVTAPMLMAMTPATPSVSFGAKQAVENVMAKVEYSFEEAPLQFGTENSQKLWRI